MKQCEYKQKKSREWPRLRFVRQTSSGVLGCSGSMLAVFCRLASTVGTSSALPFSGAAQGIMQPNIRLGTRNAKRTSYARSSANFLPVKNKKCTTAINFNTCIALRPTLQTRILAGPREPPAHPFPRTARMACSALWRRMLAELS